MLLLVLFPFLRGHSEKGPDKPDEPAPLPPPPPPMEQHVKRQRMELSDNVYTREGLNERGESTIYVDAIGQAPKIVDVDPIAPPVVAQPITLNGTKYYVQAKTPLLLRTYEREVTSTTSHGVSASTNKEYEVFTCANLTDGNMSKLPEIVNAITHGRGQIRRINSRYVLNYVGPDGHTVTYNIKRASKISKKAAIPVVRAGAKIPKTDPNALQQWIVAPESYIQPTPQGLAVYHGPWNGGSR